MYFVMVTDYCFSVWTIAVKALKCKLAVPRVARANNFSLESLL